jgi:hypothetical protein
MLCKSVVVFPLLSVGVWLIAVVVAVGIGSDVVGLYLTRSILAVGDASKRLGAV